MLDSAWRLALSGGRVSFGLAALTFIVVMVLYTLMISPANDKRRKRRYLLALTALHESWTAEEVMDEASREAATNAIETAKAG